MDRYVIERTVPGAGDMTDEELRELSASSNEVLSGMDGITWIESQVAGDRIYCLYDADDPAKLQEHGDRGGFPVDSVRPVRATISPATGD